MKMHPATKRMIDRSRETRFRVHVLVTQHRFEVLDAIGQLSNTANRSKTLARWESVGAWPITGVELADHRDTLQAAEQWALEYVRTANEHVPMPNEAPIEAEPIEAEPLPTPQTNVPISAPTIEPGALFEAVGLNPHDLREMVAAWKQQSERMAEREARGSRPRFDRTDCKVQTIRVSKQLLEDAEKLAKGQLKQQTGGTINGLVEYLLWKALESDEKYLLP